MRIAIIGAGFTGLTAGLKLSQKGHEVTLFEKEENLGGLAGGFIKNGWDWPLEFFFHHLFPTDTTAKNLTRELSLTKKLFYLKVKTSIFKNGKISRFDSPLSVLTFPYLLPQEKIRVGLVTSYLKTLANPQKFEKETAAIWLKKHYGEKSYRVLWEPLLRAKFGQEAQKISMVWFWARIKKRSGTLGYIEGGFQTLIDGLADKIKDSGGEIILNHEVKDLRKLSFDFDKVIFTGPTSVFLEVAPSLSQNEKARFKKLKMIGALNLVLVLKEKFLTDGTYWLNINDQSFPFVACVEHTNFIDKAHYGGHHLLYLGGYYPQNHHFLKMTKEEILEKFLPSLKKINPNFSPLSIIHYQLSINKFAQPIIPVNYSKIISPFKTTLKNVYLANMQQVYPWDRGVNYAIEMGERIAKIINSNG